MHVPVIRLHLYAISAAARTMYAGAPLASNGCPPFLIIYFCIVLPSNIRDILLSFYKEGEGRLVLAIGQLQLQ